MTTMTAARNAEIGFIVIALVICLGYCARGFCRELGNLVNYLVRSKKDSTVK